MASCRQHLLQGEESAALVRRFGWVGLLVVAGCYGTAELGPAPELLAGLAPTLDDGGLSTGGGAGGSGGGAGGGVNLPDAGAPDAGVPDAGATDACVGFFCASGSHCVTGPTRCVCNPGLVADGGLCVPGDPGVPALRTQAQVCDGWARGHVTTAPQPFSKTTATCDPGVLSRGGLDDTLARLNMFRWLVGLGPVSDDASDNDAAQKCALMSSWNPAGPAAHNPPTTATCYTAAGAAGAGSSNIAWGSGSPAGAIDQWLIDNGNESTMGHRRWLLNPPLDPVGIGYYEGGNNYGSASCIRVFSGGNVGPKPSWFAFPPPGFVPAQVTQWIWSVHGTALTGGFDAGVTRLSDGAGMPVTVQVMQGGYGQPAITLNRSGWAPAVGQTYRVVVTGTSMAPISYEVTPVSCP